LEDSIVRKLISFLGVLPLFFLYPLIAWCLAFESASFGEGKYERKFLLCLTLGITGMIGCGYLWITPLPMKVPAFVMWGSPYLLGCILQWRWMLEYRDARRQALISPTTCG
jgi:hypothetical protein